MDNSKMNQENKVEEEKNFGFQTVSAEKKRNLIDEVFSGVAEKYDIMNDLMSFGTHRLWKDEFVAMIPNLDSNIIDVAGGTGDISFRIKKRAVANNKKPKVVVCDINTNMLKICRDKAINNNFIEDFDIVACDAEHLPFPDNSFDYYTIAFGIRNMICLERTLKEAYRVLKPTGKFLCLEFSRVQNDFMRPLYDYYSFNLIPGLGGAVAKNKQAYQYLAESISIFPEQEAFKEIITESGFKNVEYKNLTFGIAAIHSGYKI